jgi:hypothetical protein
VLLERRAAVRVSVVYVGLVRFQQHQVVRREISVSALDSWQGEVFEKMT